MKTTAASESLGRSSAEDSRQLEETMAQKRTANGISSAESAVAR